MMTMVSGVPYLLWNLAATSRDYRFDLVQDLVYIVIMQVNIHQAKTSFSKLIESALHGEEVIIARAGKPLLRLVPIQGARQPRTPGLSTGKIRIADDFDEPLDEDVLLAFET